MSRVQARRVHGVVAALCLWAAQAQALQIIGLTPQGEVARVRQVVAKFDESAVAFGDPKAAAPLALSCSDAQATQGSGRWISDREWAFEFANDLPPGVKCTLQARAGYTSPKGAPLTGTTQFRFTTGGPFVQNVYPGTYERLDEEQVFALRLNGAATAASVSDKVWCALDSLGERVPVKAVEGAQRAAILKALGLEKEAAAEPLRIHTLACKRRLTPSTQVQLVYGKGVATPSGVPNSTERRYTWRVREPFEISFSCERENAQAGCLPMQPMTLRFNAPVPRKLAEGLRLVSPKDSTKPTLDEGQGDAEEVVNSVSFAAPFPEQTAMTLELPRGFADASGRAARNADKFPLKVATGQMPPLAKFAAAPFGIVERFAEPDGVALLPVTLRNVEARLSVQGLNPQGKVSDLRPGSDAEIIRWFRKLQRYDEPHVGRDEAKRDGVVNLPKVTLEGWSKERVETRAISLLSGMKEAKTLDLPRPAGNDPRPFEVVGIPLTPGFHVVEIASPRLGQSLLHQDYGDARTMYVRSSALVTNLGVHFKLGRENAVAWVTTLDKGQPVAGAAVQVSSCSGQLLAQGSTDARGVVEFKGLSPQPPYCNGRTQTGGDEGEVESGYGGAYFVSARATDAKGVQDLAFTWSNWTRGIEPWRFNQPTSRDARPTLRAHTVFDRALLRAGETVGMKHYVRKETRQGFGLPPEGDLPVNLVVTHVGSGQQYTQKIGWRKTGTGGLAAESSLPIPAAAKLGVYQVELQGGAAGAMATGQFRVEEFRLPVLQGQVSVSAVAPGADKSKTALVQPKEVPVGVQVSYVAGGAAANLPVQVSALVRPKALHFADYDAYSFNPPRGKATASADGEEDARLEGEDQRVIADKLPLTLNRQGSGQVSIKDVPPARQPRQLLLEASYADPNGEVQTLRSSATLWPAAVIAGIKTEGWVSLGGPGKQSINFQALALDLNGKPKAGVPLSVRAQARITTSSRKRMVGGFYSYDNKTEVKDLGEVCSGKSDERGLLLCDAAIHDAGEVELVASAKDGDGNTAQAASSVWVTRQGELWFGGSDTDRIDLLPEKRFYQPGETAKFQVRMPFRFATALVAVEREGIIDTQVVQLNGQDPTVSLKVSEAWGPNVYVSVLALRGRLREVPWYSFFTWGYKAPREWWTAFWYEGREYVAPTALVDLSKPAFRLGVAEIRVGTAAHQLDVKVAADKPSYPVRGKAQVTVSVKLPNGQPAAGAEVALAAVDQALLELMPNASWNLLEAMLQPRAWGVETSTAQMEIIGRRHYGRKAVPAGGGGGQGAARELLDTLLLWNPRVVLDAKGQAVVSVPLNDALTTFKIVAVADAGTGQFGTGSTSIQATQDLQIISGLPPLVREDDEFRAMLTLRNTTAKPMKVEATPRVTLLSLAPQTVDIPAGEARELSWAVTVPAQLGATRNTALMWEIEARDTLGGARDALKVTQRVLPAVPLTVQQATLVQLDGPYTLDVAPPADGLPEKGAKRGGLKLALQPKLAEGLPGVRDWFANYPFACLEQKTSKSIGLRDLALWQGVVNQIPSYLDSDGLANYFPPREGDANHGSDVLTAYVLAATHEAAALDAAYALPDSVRAPMERGLIAFVEGRISRDYWSPRKDLDVRKLAAIEALSRYGMAKPALLQSITVAPNQWPTHAVIDWLSILRRVQGIPKQAELLAEANQVLKSRLSYQGTKLIFSTERDDYWWWLMANGDVNTARLMLAVMDDPAWKDDMGRLANGFIQRQQGGAWHTTTANFWGGLALERFSRVFEAVPVAGSTKATLGSASAAVDWAKVERIKTGDAQGLPHQGSWFGAPASPGNLRNNTMFLPWTAAAKDTLAVTHQGAGKPWLTLQSVAAVALKAPFSAGYAVKKTITPLEQAVKGQYTRGDVLRITVEVNASADMSWVVLSDPVPAGATILGNGLGRDSEIASQGEKKQGDAWAAYEERSFEAYRSYYEYLPKGSITVEYTLRLNNAGSFAMPPTRVEAMYAPEMFGEFPNARLKVEQAR